MKKGIKILLIVLLVAAVIAAGVMIVMNLIAKNHAPLVSYGWGYGGDMSGSSSSLKIAKQGDKALVISSKKDWYAQDPQVEEYLVPLSTLERVEELFDKYKMYKYDKLPENPVHALDAGSTSYRVSYEDDAYMYFSDNQIIPSKGYDGLRAIDAVIKEAMASGERLPGLVLDRGSGDDDYYTWQPAEGTAGLHVFEYCDGVLTYKFGNSTGNDIQLEGKNQLFRLEGDERVEIYSDADTYYWTVYDSYYNDEETVRVGRLEPGRYVLTFAGYEEEFEIR